jgi:G3E family GTPase
MDRISGDRRIPVTLLTGYLGAGKSTVLAALLEHAASSARRIALINNEFAQSLLTEDPLPGAASAADVVEFRELAGGCLCCSLSTSFVRVVEDIVRKGGCDAIVVETTGLADPLPVASLFIGAPDEDGAAELSLSSSCRLHSICAVLDTPMFLATLHDAARPSECVNEAAQQVLYADRILLNKLDACTLVRAEAVEAAVRALNPTAELQRVIFGRCVDGGHVSLNVFGEDVHRSLALDRVRLAPPRRADPHDPSVRAVSATLRAGPVDLSLLRAFIYELLQQPSESADEPNRPDGGCCSTKPSDSSQLGSAPLPSRSRGTASRVLRAKGCFDVGPGRARYVLQGVATRFELACGARWPEGEPPFSKLAIIGRDLPSPAQLKAALQRCMLPVGAQQNDSSTQPVTSWHD